MAKDIDSNKALSLCMPILYKSQTNQTQKWKKDRKEQIKTRDSIWQKAKLSTDIGP